jgi:threonylcarbamoyladenosine tRNA methylthiotransferase MtaB
VLRQTSALAEKGYREVVLTGVHLGTWGRDLSPPRTLASLLKKLVELPGLERLRLSSVEPTEFTGELMEVLSSEKICPHLHIPLQSGSSKVLQAMGRPYGPRTYAGIVEELARRIPDLGLGADVIAGFPGEGEREFEETVSLVTALPFSYLHVFPYSKRPGTVAADLPEQVPPEKRDRRASILRKLGREKASAFRQERVGRSYETLIETPADGDTGLGRGITGNYLKVLVEARPDTANTIRTVRLSRYEEGRLYGNILA